MGEREVGQLEKTVIVPVCTILNASFFRLDAMARICKQLSFTKVKLMEKLSTGCVNSLPGTVEHFWRLLHVLPQAAVRAAD